MKLHLDSTAFRALIDKIGKDNLKLKATLEKDYFVTLILNELASNPDMKNVYFKGGTALYKALKSIKRFSEDIDLSVDASNLTSGNKKTKRVKEIARGFISLKRGPEQKGDISGNIAIGRYSYNPIYKIEGDRLNRVGNVKIEINCFSVIEPSNELIIAPHLYELCDKNDKKILEEKFGVKPFKIKTMTIQRIFVDKLFAIENYYLQKKYLDVAKHAYDVSTLYNLPEIKTLLLDKEKFKNIVSYKIEEETHRKKQIFNKDTKVQDFTYFKDLKNDKGFINSYNQMLSDYVFSESDRLLVDCVISTLEKIKNECSH